MNLKQSFTSVVEDVINIKLIALHALLSELESIDKSSETLLVNTRCLKVVKPVVSKLNILVNLIWITSIQKLRLIKAVIKLMTLVGLGKGLKKN
jgi:hypothetical protein